MFFLDVATHKWVNRVEGIPPITNKMCVTRSKEKVWKYAPVRMYVRVHYYKREMCFCELDGIRLQ
ncbi:hypothetical protein DXB65_18065 [Bacteroides oleiciplenus]|uniref:Uncharacterized protein n=1 Tax=Bacteroides oleiciplenus TaxID=626931 RepID=A0A3E5B530_9BACE|nr:hypothetical protein DXB65_18065 [Bacteroides oleiciplenus]